MDLGPTHIANLLRYFGQVLVVIAAAAVALHAIRPSAPRVRLIFWRIAIAICLLLPLLPIPRVIDPAPAAVPAAASATASSVAAPADLASHIRLRMQPIADAAASLLPWVLLAGAAARAAWLGIGLLGLRRLRAASRAIDLDVDMASPDAAAARLAADIASLTALRDRLAPRAELRCQDSVTQPVTFGLLRPIILLPPRLADLPSDAQRAIVCHELLHVARHDWAWTLLDEAVRTAMWWHPAIWWALAQVHLQREETIDARVVALTAARQPYMRALMLFADAPDTTRATVPAAAHMAIPFIRRRHLAARLRQLAQEVSMPRISRFRLTCTIAALAAILATAGWTSAAALPLHTQTQEPQPDKAVRLTGEHPPKLITKVNPDYPEDAKEQRIEGIVAADVRIAKDGTVADVKMIKSIPALDEASADALRKWKFEPVIIDDEPVEAIVTVAIQFRLQ